MHPYHNWGGSVVRWGPRKGLVKPLPCTEEASVCVCDQHNFPFLIFLRRKLLLACQGWQSQAWGLFQLPQNFAPCSALAPSPFSACPCGCFVTIFVISSRSQGRGSNVIHCRKDGTWSGSFHLCREMQGQCALPTQLNSHLKLQCAGGYGIGL